jgi:hypothetical protein
MCSLGTDSHQLGLDGNHSRKRETYDALFGNCVEPTDL